MGGCGPASCRRSAISSTPAGYQAGAVVCIQTFAENLRWNPHAHVLLLSGFHVHIGPPLDPAARSSALEGLARYLVHAPVRHAQLQVGPDPSEDPGLSADSDHDRPSDSAALLRLQRPDQVTGATVESLSGLELLARLTLHLPQPYQPMRFYYGAYF